MEERKLYRDRNLLIIFGVTLMAVLAVSSIAPAFPKIVKELEISPQQVGLLITAFTFPGVVLTPFLGIMADRFGRKRVLVPSLFLFGIAGTACALTRDFDVLIVFRVFQGIGGAALGSLNVTIIGDLYPGRRLTQAMGLNASVLSIGTASYPTIGGAMALLGWYYPFFLSLAALPTGLLVLTLLRNPEPRSRESFRDYLGGTWGYLKNLKVAALFAAGVLTFILLYGAFLTYFPLLLGESFHASPFVIGLIASCSSLSTAAVSSQLGRITKRFSEGTLIKTAFAIYALALVSIPLVPSLWLFLIPAIIFGLAQGMNIPSIHTLVAGLAPLDYRAAFMSVNATMLRLGQTVGPPLIGLFYVYWGFNATFFAAAALSLLAPLLALIWGKKSSA